MLSLYDWYRRAEDYWRCNPDQRYGQALFNYLYITHPDMADAIRGTENDPFHVKGMSHPTITNFGRWLHSNWEN